MKISDDLARVIVELETFTVRDYETATGTPHATAIRHLDDMRGCGQIERIVVGNAFVFAPGYALIQRVLRLPEIDVRALYMPTNETFEALHEMDQIPF